jgi:4-hydroxy-3-methylbut-2-enyl diphosphate reductase
MAGMPLEANILLTVNAISKFINVKAQWLEGKQVTGITAGASAPEILVKDVVDKLRFFGAEIPQENHGEPENISFSLPKELHR